ncbi:hypothetical protein FJZ33_05835, partial [Candidatus Poribacteria bacterium]|nr:hypothetical protein [Candidatus Poribacteria bacterium]
GSGTQPTGGMVLYLPFDEGNGSIVKDLSGYGNNGVTKGKVEWAQGIKGTALSFSKDWQGHVEVPDSNSLDVSQQITISAWIRPSKIYIGNDQLQMNDILVKFRSYYLTISEKGKLSLYLYGIKPEGWLYGSADMTRFLNTWVHVAAVYDGQERRLYINGKLDASAKASGTISVTTYPLTLGFSSHNRYFDGIIDEVKIWSRALTGNEIADLANIGSTPIVCDGPVSTKGPSKDPVLMGTDPDDSQEANLNQISAYSSNNKIYFSVSTYKTIGDNFSISVSMDIDQNKKTGHVESYGADYAIDFGMEDGKLFNELWVWDKNKGEWVKTNSDVSYVPPILPGNIFFFNVNLKDINNPKVIDFLTTMAIKKSGKWTVIDNSPDKCYYRYNLGENQIPSVSRNLIIPEVSGAPGKSVTVPINISDASGVAGGDINVIYDPKVLKITEIKPTVLSASMNLVSNTNTSGKIILRLAGTNAITSGNGSLIDMIFTIDASAAVGTETPVRFESAEVFDANGNNIVIGTQNGKVKVISDCVKGDVNGDGSIKSNDAILTLRISAGLLVPTDQQLCAADYNNDKQVKSNDAILILRKSADLIAPEKGPIVSGNRNINVTLDRIYGAAGQSITVPFRVDNSQILAGGDIQVAYNSSVLRATEVFSDEKILLVGNVSEPGVIRIAFAIAESLRRETIAYIKFDIISDYSSPLSIKRHELYDCYGVLLDSKAIDKDFISYNLPPEDSLLLQNFPNPFNPDTWIPYQINENSEVVIWILNTKGEVVRKLDLGNKQAGLYITQDRAAYWDGKDDSGNPVASGVYFYSIKAGKLWDTKKMIVVK